MPRATPMFGWFGSKQNKPRELSFDVIADILGKYGALLEKYPTAYVDEIWLPAPKDEMRRVFRTAWRTVPNLQLRNSIEVGWASLSKFQPNVGPVPVDADPSSVKML